MDFSYLKVSGRSKIVKFMAKVGHVFTDRISSREISWDYESHGSTSEVSIMAISVQPVDGLIHRLLQQNGKPVSSVQAQAGNAGPRHDHISISADAQTQNPAQSTETATHTQNRPGEKALESHLLNLYRSNDQRGG